MDEFIAHDWCGWDQRYSRFTHVPSGDTLLCQPDMGQVEWDKAQLDWLSKYPGLMIYKCPGAYNTSGRKMGTTDVIYERLSARLSSPI